MASVQQVALACSIDVRRVQQLAKEGVLERDVRGDYDLGRCMMAYIRYLQAAMKAKSAMDDTGKISNTAGQRSKLLDVEVQREELALAKDRSEVMSIADHESILSTLIIETKATLMAVGPRLAPRLVGETNRATIQAAIDAGQKEAMMKLSLSAPAARPVKKVAKKSEPAAPLAPRAAFGPLQAARREFGALLVELLHARVPAPPVLSVTSVTPATPATPARRGRSGTRRPAGT